MSDIPEVKCEDCGEWYEDYGLGHEKCAAFAVVEPPRLCQAKTQTSPHDAGVRRAGKVVEDTRPIAAVCTREAGHVGDHFDPALNFWWAVVEPPREGRILSADVVKRLRTAMVHRNVLNDLCDSHELLRSALSAAQQESLRVTILAANALCALGRPDPRLGGLQSIAVHDIPLGNRPFAHPEARPLTFAEASEIVANAERSIAASRPPSTDGQP